MGDETIAAPEKVSMEDLLALQAALLREQNGRLVTELAQMQRNAILAKYGPGVSVNTETGNITRAG